MFQGLKKGALGANWVIGMQQYRQVCTRLLVCIPKNKTKHYLTNKVPVAN